MINAWNYLDDYAIHRKEILGAVDRVFSSGRLILGDEVASFERRFASLCGVPFGVGVNSGTDALFLSLKALDIGQGDEVITVANTAVPTVAAIRATGATPVFADVMEDSFLIDISCIESSISGKTRCIIPVHLLGQPVDMPCLMKTAAAKGLSVVEDCAQAAGAMYQGKAVGSFGDIGAFSFYPTKVLGAFGDAGMAITANGQLHDRLRKLRFYGMENAYYSEEEGYNSRLDEVQAAILNLKLESLELAICKRRSIAEHYSRDLEGVGDILVPSVFPERFHVFYAYTIQTSHRDALARHLARHGIETRINYPFPVHLMRGYRFLGYKEGDLPVTERLAGRILSLPVFPELSEQSVHEVITAIRGFFETCE
ncbi:MAG: DegT/DnrJ/EryC1/StrS family aminotransferase [Nitrospirae bacterium]|nr:DegT/DnrJ/EryC1/StrS family aminotransferase [Nitrospirota bacterium]